MKTMKIQIVVLGIFMIASNPYQLKGQSSIEGHMQYWVFQNIGYKTVGFGASVRNERTEKRMLYSGGSFVLPVKGNISGQYDYFNFRRFNWGSIANADAEISNWSVYCGIRRTRHMKNVERFHFHFNYEIGYQWDKLLITSIVLVDTSKQYSGDLPITMKRRGFYFGYGFGFEVQATDNGGIFVESKIDLPIQSALHREMWELPYKDPRFFHYVIRAGYRYRFDY
jgi:hypothetical protein